MPNMHFSHKIKYPETIAHGIMFHHFHDSRHYQGQGSISQENFEKLINFIGLDRIISPDEWMKRLDAGRLKDEDICLTFDDGLVSQFDVALPILEKYNLRAFWFIYSNVFDGQLSKLEIYRVFRSKFFQDIDSFYNIFFDKIFRSKFKDKARAVIKEEDVNRYNKIYPFYTTNDIRFRFIRDRALTTHGYEIIMDTIIKEHGLTPEELSKNLWMSNDSLVYLNSRGHTIGLHSYSHPTVLADLSFEGQAEEYRRNYDHIRRICGKSPVVMAHPVNSYNDDTFKVLSQLDIRCGFRSNMFPKREGGRLNDNKYEIARDDHSNIMRISSIK
ncbi:MAG: polysaccharide deacetylase family protein [Candidatus Taylorbacteria bacterium]|nr:polysaccharide deacetylase family protein [Candidatus Taylorbacteria bacterium]